MINEKEQIKTKHYGSSKREKQNSKELVCYFIVLLTLDFFQKLTTLQ